MLVSRAILALLTMAAILCMAPGISVLATAGQTEAPSCCKPTSPCGAGLMAADCCRVDRAPQAEAPAVAPIAMNKKQLQVATQPPPAQIAGEWLAAASARKFGERIDCQAGARAPSTPLFLTHAALLI
jgi:hypothetical protein